MASWAATWGRREVIMRLTSASAGTLVANSPLNAVTASVTQLEVSLTPAAKALMQVLYYPEC